MMSRRDGSGMVSTARVLGVLLLAFVLSGCAVSPTIRTDGAPGVNLGEFDTFSFFTPLSTDRAGFHSLVSQQLMFSTRREMEVRGFRFVENPAEADLLINFHTHVAEQVRVRSVPDPWIGPSYWHHRRGFYDPWRGHSHWPTHNRVEVDQFSEGRLSVDLIDRRQNMLVWEAVASKRLTQRTLNDLGPAMDDAVHEMFRRFPLPAMF
jgi:hypothetical protein